MPKLPNSLRGPGGEARPSGKGDSYHGFGVLFVLLSFFAAYALSFLLSWWYFSSMAKGPDPWGWSWIGVWLASIYSMIVFPILAILFVIVGKLIPYMRNTLSGYPISLAIAALVTPYAAHGFMWLMLAFKGQ